MHILLKLDKKQRELDYDSNLTSNCSVKCYKQRTLLAVTERGAIPTLCYN